MSSDKPIVSQTGHQFVVPLIDESDCQRIAENASKDTQLDLNSEAVEANKCGSDSELRVPAPPPRKLFRTGSMRKTDEKTDATDTLAIGSDQISDSSHPTNTHFKSCDNESTPRVTNSSHNKVDQVLTTSDTKSEPKLRDNSTQCLTTDLITCKSNVKTCRTQPMDRIRQWIASDEAKAKRRRRLNRCLYCMKVFLTHLFSTTGLCLLVVAYTCVGAVIFTFLESKNEVIQRDYVQKERTECARDIWNYTLTRNVLYPDQLNHEINERLMKFEEMVVKAVREEGYGGTSDQWTFSGALLYSVTVITTIGYGNVTCKTSWGRIVTMVYALIGIPVMFLCLANLGNLMAQTFRFSYRRICCFCCCDRLNNRFNKKQETNKSLQKSLKSQNERIELKNCIQKDVKLVFDENDEQKVQTIIELMPSTPPTASSLTSSQVSSPSKSHSSPVKSESNEDHKEMVIVPESRLSVESNEDRVPVWLVILLVISYIMAGASMFSLWEKDWNFLDGAYFCFTTLTTIGFGDLVPGSAKYSDNAEEQTKFIICCAYLIVGLSLLAMSFNLVQEEIVIKAKEFGRKIGIIPKTECDSSVSV